ncbi:AEC family transporter [Stutzerimonas nitrititolerans]|uniref:AEC family transporter n=1 Tax=Stutzerimonas nitrititolerans TaxID=2482751 RepID=UPI0028A5A9CB|nr:AEC family transporter [Stutzerimonas nitrititolerans]
MLVQIVSIVFPVFTVIAVGYLYGRKHRPDMFATNQLNMGIFVPALVFSALAGKSVDLAHVQTIALGGLVVVLGSGLLGWPIARRLGYDPKTLLPPMMFKNAGNMGLPLLLFAFGEQALPAAVVLFLVENILHFAVVTWWLGHNAKLWRLLREPVIIAGIAGVLVSLSGVTLWPPLLSAVKIIADVSTGLMLFSLGVRLNTAPFAQWRIGAVGAVATPIAGMLIAYLFCLAFGLSSHETDILLVFGALPPAVLNFMFAELYRQEPEKVASIVILGNLVALLSISLALALRLA